MDKTCELVDYEETDSEIIGECNGHESEFVRRSELQTDEQESELADALRVQWFATNDFFRGVFHEARRRFCSVSASSDVLRTFDTLALALGYSDVAGANTSAELAARYGKKRQTVNKPLNELISIFNLPPLPGQRDSKAVRNITNGRNKNKRTK